MTILVRHCSDARERYSCIIVARVGQFGFIKEVAMMSSRFSRARNHIRPEFPSGESATSRNGMATASLDSCRFLNEFLLRIVFPSVNLLYMC